MEDLMKYGGALLVAMVSAYSQRQGVDVTPVIIMFLALISFEM